MLVKNLLGATDLADRLGFEFPQSIHNLRRRHPSFPAPCATINGTQQVWDWPEVEAWAIANGRMNKSGEPIRAPRSRPKDATAD